MTTTNHQLYLKHTEVLDAYNLKQHVKKTTRQSVKTIDHIVSNLETEKVLMTDVLSCPIVSDHDAPYATIKIPVACFRQDINILEI